MTSLGGLRECDDFCSCRTVSGRHHVLPVPARAWYYAYTGDLDPVNAVRRLASVLCIALTCSLLAAAEHPQHVCGGSHSAARNLHKAGRVAARHPLGGAGRACCLRWRSSPAAGARACDGTPRQRAGHPAAPAGSRGIRARGAARRRARPGALRGRRVTQRDGAGCSCGSRPAANGVQFSTRAHAVAPQVVTAYLMKSEGLSARAAAEALVRVHPRAWPNEGFRRALDMCARSPALRAQHIDTCVSSAGGAALVHGHVECEEWACAGGGQRHIPVFMQSWLPSCRLSMRRRATVQRLSHTCCPF